MNSLNKYLKVLTIKDGVTPTVSVCFTMKFYSRINDNTRHMNGIVEFP